MTGLSHAQRDQLDDVGFVMVPALLDPTEDLDPIVREYHTVLDRLVHQLHAAGAIGSTYDDLDFSDRVTEVYRETGKPLHQHFDFALPRTGVTEATPIWVGPAVFAALTNPRLLDAVETVIGAEIFANPIQHVRIKPPQRYVPKAVAHIGLMGATPWHQDNGVVTPDADDTQMLTVWFPLTDAPVECGCLQVIPGSHRQGLRDHCPGKTGELHIPNQLIDTDRAVPVPMRRGDVLFLHRRTCHGSLPNLSDRIRFSFDLRYQPIGQPTGRSVFPGFVARSRTNPASELHDPAVWAELWYETRRQLARATEEAQFNRWHADAEACA